MYNSEETKWFSQVLFYFKDKSDGSDSSLRLSTSTGSSDLANFTIAKLSIQIQNHLHKSVNLDLHDVRDLLIGIRENMKRSNPLDGEPTIRKITYNNEISISFHSPSDPKAKITIRSSETDFAYVIIPIAKFKTVLKIMEQFVTSYITIADGLVLRSISYQLNKLDDLNRNVRGLYSSFENSRTTQDNIHNSIPDNGASEQYPNMDAESVAATIDLSDQLDQFLGPDMGNVKIPEIVENKVEERQETTITEIKSKLFSATDNNIRNVFNLFNQEVSFDSLTAKLSAVVDFEVLPGIDDKTLKMITYFTKLYVDLITSSAVQFNTQIPAGFPVIKYKPIGATVENVDLAYDLFLVGAYLKTFRRLLENHQSDVFSNYSIEHLKFRSFTDAFVFSMLSDKSIEKVLSSVMSRYDYYKKIGAFNWVDEELKKGNYPEITKSDINDYITEVAKRAFSSTTFDQFYEKARELHKLKLTMDNDLTIEQIKNELIPLEIKEKLTHKIEDSDFESLSQNVIDIFKKKKKSSAKQMNPLQMFVKKCQIQIPEDQVDKLIDFLKDYSDKKIDFDNFPFQIEDFEEDVLKALYYWNPETHKNATSLKNDLDDNMTKDLILAKIKNNNSVEDTAGFGDVFGNIDLS